MAHEELLYRLQIDQKRMYCLADAATGKSAEIKLELSRIINLYLQRQEPADDTLWHKWNTILPVKLDNGDWSWDAKQLWRRRTASGWQFRADEQSRQEWLDDQI